MTVTLTVEEAKEFSRKMAQWFKERHLVFEKLFIDNVTIWNSGMEPARGMMDVRVDFTRKLITADELYQKHHPLPKLFPDA